MAEENKTWETSWTYIEQVIETVHELFLILDENLKVIGANKKFYDFFQTTKEETVSQVIYELGDGQWDIAKLKILLEAYLPQTSNDPNSNRIFGHFEEFIVDYNFPKIGRKTLVLNARKIYKADGKTPMLLISIQDATSQKELEEILMSVGDGLIVTNKDGKIAMVNKAFENLLGWKQEEVIGKNMTDVVIQVDESGKAVLPEDRILTQVLAGKKTVPSNKTWFFVNKNKKKFPVSSVVNPIVISNEITGAVEVFRDITKERELDKSKTEFVSIASHQLRTPLSTINWYTEMLLSEDVGKISKKQKGYLDQIYQGNKRMIALVNSLLNVSRLELNTFMIQPEPAQLQEIADNVLHDLKIPIKKRKIDFHKTYDKDLSQIKVDIKLTRIIFDNLLSNAVKYTLVGGKVSLDISVKKPNVIITVWNNGPGIPAEAQHNIFTKMFRDDLARQRDPDGNGLGLYIIKSILSNAGGRVWFESDDDNGTFFHVSIPLSGMKEKEGNKNVE